MSWKELWERVNVKGKVEMWVVLAIIAFIASIFLARLWWNAYQRGF
jgi:DNA-binding transcriptional regulator of glucitol operon